MTEEVRLKLGNVVISTQIPIGGYYASENGSDDPAAIYGLGTWRKISPAYTVEELLNLSGEDNFVTIGMEEGEGLFVWKRIS